VVGRTVERVEARGKWLLIYFSGDLILVTHMLMSGSWHIYRTGEKWWMPKKAMRVVIRVGPASEVPHSSHEAAMNGPPGVLAGFEAVAFNVPVAEFYTARSLERSSQVPKLGVDVLGDAYSVEAGVKAMREYGAAHPEAEIAVVLLNQRVLAGLGNVYKSEVAFAAGVNPFRQMRTITERELAVMAEFAQKYMRANVVDGKGDGIVTYAGNRRTTHEMDGNNRLWVYRRQGEECRRCGAAIMMRKQGTAVRSTYWCASCQPWVAAEGQSGDAPVGKQVKAREWTAEAGKLKKEATPKCASPVICRLLFGLGCWNRLRWRDVIARVSNCFFNSVLFGGVYHVAVILKERGAVDFRS
jgi:endonuclease-8